MLDTWVTLRKLNCSAYSFATNTFTVITVMFLQHSQPTVHISPGNLTARLPKIKDLLQNSPNVIDVISTGTQTVSSHNLFFNPPFS